MRNSQKQSGVNTKPLSKMTVKQIATSLFCVPLLMGATSNIFQIRGVEGKLLTNIQSRLHELGQNTPLSEQTDDELKGQIEKAMYPYGFLKPDINIIHDKPLRISINPGSQLFITQLKTSVVGDGKDNPEMGKVLHTLLIKQGDAFNSEKYETAKQSLLEAAHHEGYLQASYDTAEILIDKKNYTATITLAFNTGPQFFFGQVRFDPTYISQELLQRYIPFQWGKPYSSEQLMAFNDYLVGSGYFKRVLVKPQIDNNLTIPIDVHLEPASRVNYSLGVGFGTDTGVRGRAGMNIIPFNHLGHKFSALAVGSFNENAIQTQYIIPGKNPLTDQYEITNNISNLNYDAGYSNSILLSLANRHKTTNFQRVLSLNNLYERFNYTDKPKVAKYSLFPKASLTWLNTPNPLFSPTGYNVTLNGFFANKALLSGMSFSEASIDAKAALTLDQLRTRLYFHSIYGLTQVNNINQFPLSLSLLLGGSENLKGYEYNSIGPGKQLVYGGFELQKETKDHWYLIGFYDAGDTYNPNVKSLKQDVGIGLMWASPIGPIKLGLAQPIDSNFNRLSGKNPRLVINMGPDL